MRHNSYCTSVMLLFIAMMMMLRAEARHSHHGHSKHHGHHHKSSGSHISEPPSPAPEPSAEPPYIDDDPSTAVFDIRRFGGVGDGVTDDTGALKMAWDAACRSTADSSVTVVVPEGYSFLIKSAIFAGPCKKSIVFQLDGTVVPPDGPDSWPKGNSRRQWLVFYRLDGFSLQGAGLIDGRGRKWWDLPCKPHKSKPGPCDSPVAIRFFMSSNLKVEGIKMKNSPQFHMRFDGCENVNIESITINAPALSPNTDGIHIENTKNVGIYNSAVSNGDDCVSIGTGCRNVDIKNVTCGPGGHGISIGSLGNHNSRACVSNVTVRESTIRGSANGVRIKTWQGGSGRVSEVTFSDIRMDGVRNPIIIDQFYCLNKPCRNATSAVQVADVEYRNIKGTYDGRSPAVRFACSESVPCANLTVSGLELVPESGEFVAEPLCWNAYAVDPQLTIPPLFSCFLQGVPTGSTLESGDNALCYP